MRNARLAIKHGKYIININQEDANFVKLSKDTGIFGVFDGHGGKI